VHPRRQDLQKNIRAIGLFSAPTIDHSTTEAEGASSLISGLFKIPSSLNPFLQTSQRKRVDLLIMLRETLKICTKVKITAKGSNELVKEMAREILGPVLHELNETAQLEEILGDLNICAFKEMNVRCIFERTF